MAKRDDRMAVGYLRLSHGDVEKGELAWARQRAAIEKVADAHGVTIGHWYQEVVSAYSRTRTRAQYQAMLEAVTAGRVSAIYTYSVDRLLRQTRDLVGLIDVLEPRKVAVHAAMGSRLDLSSSEGRLSARMLGALAEFESDRRSERVTAKNHQRATVQRIARSGGPRPFGWRYRDDGAPGLVIDEVEAAALLLAYEQVEAGHTLSEVCRGLNDGGHRGPTGAKFTPTTLKHMLLSQRHCGMVEYRGEVIGPASDGQAIVSTDLHRRVVRILQDPTRPNAGVSPNVTLLGGLIWCICGSKMTSTVKTAGERGRTPTVPVYRCRNCLKTRRQSLVVPSVIEAVAMYLDLHAEAWAAAPAATDPEQQKIAADIARLERDIEQLADALAAGDLDVESYAVASKRLRADVAARQARLATRPRVAVVSLGSDSPGDRWAEMAEGDPSAARRILTEVVQAVRLLPGSGPHGRATATDLEIDWRP